MNAQFKLAKIYPVDVDPRLAKESFASLVKAVSDYKSLTVDVRALQDPEPLEMGDGKTAWVAVVDLRKDHFQSSEAASRQIENASRIMTRQAQAWQWNVLEVESNVEGESGPRPEVIIVSETVIDLPELTPEVMATQFGRFYDREPHIRFIYDSARAAATTAFQMRNHVLLWGEASGAKSSLLLAFADWFGNRVWRIDASTTTKAGLETELYNKAKGGVLPPFMLIEEIEAAPEQNLYCLLQVMDERGRIQRTNARTGDRFAECKIVVWATCNDYKKLQTFKSRALWSRFGLRLRCDRPDADLMRKILKREMRLKGGKEEWVDRVVDFMYKELSKDDEWLHDFDDTRLGLALLASGDRVLDDGPEGALADYRKVMVRRND